MEQQSEAALQYVVEEELGTGSFGRVVRARCRTDGELVAIKQIERTQLNRYTVDEIRNHSMLRHPHVIRLREAFLTQTHVNIVLEYANGGSLFSFVHRKGRLSETSARWFFQQLVIALDYTHRMGVCMRDIKLENTLLQYEPNKPRPLIKVCDFGYSKHDNRSLPKSKVGTVTYMAPEVIKTGPVQDRYDGKRADIWSAGVMLYTMLVGQYPFRVPKQQDDQHAPQLNHMVAMLHQMESRQYALPESLGLCDECKDLLHRLLDPKPCTRATVAEIVVHPWFTQDLPSGAMQMNDRYVEVSKAQQQQQLL